MIFCYCNKNININDELIKEYEKTQSKFSVRTIDYLLKTSDGNEDMTPNEIKKIVEEGIREELDFERKMSGIIKTMETNGEFV